MARKWEDVISYEDRGDQWTTSRWQLTGVATKEGAENTDSGTLWLKCTGTAAAVTPALYKDDGCGAATMVAEITGSGTVDLSGCDNTGANAAEVVLVEANSSGLSGSVWFHQYLAAGTCPVQVALCVDEDLDALCDGLESTLASYDSTNGCAEFIRVAQVDVIGTVLAKYTQQLDGASGEAWFITDASRVYPDLRRIANPGQLRKACAHHAIETALGSQHQRAGDTMYSELRDYHQAEYEKAMERLKLAFKAGSGDNIDGEFSTTVVRLERA